MIQSMRVRSRPTLAIVRVLVTLALFGLALVDGHKLDVTGQVLAPATAPESAVRREAR